MGLFRLAPLAAIFALTMGACAHAQELPEGQGKAVVQTACGQCHGIDVIVGQSRSRGEWGEVISRMVGNGAQLSDDDYNLAIEYLATHLGPASQNAPAKGASTSTASGGKSRN
ncbi:MAG: cytochrome c [Pseudomonadota bacterium]